MNYVTYTEEKAILWKEKQSKYVKTLIFVIGC